MELEKTIQVTKLNFCVFNNIFSIGTDLLQGRTSFQVPHYWETHANVSQTASKAWHLLEKLKQYNDQTHLNTM